MTITEFMAQVRKRRTIHLLWWLALPVTALPFLWVFGHLPRGLFTFEPGPFFGLLSWFAVLLWLGHRLTSLKCPYCANRAFGPRPFFSTRGLRCTSCGRHLSDEGPK